LRALTDQTLLDEAAAGQRVMEELSSTTGAIFLVLAKISISEAGVQQPGGNLDKEGDEEAKREGASHGGQGGRGEVPRFVDALDYEQAPRVRRELFAWAAGQNGVGLTPVPVHEVRGPGLNVCG